MNQRGTLEGASVGGSRVLGYPTGSEGTRHIST